MSVYMPFEVSLLRNFIYIYIYIFKCRGIGRGAHYLCIYWA